MADRSSEPADRARGGESLLAECISASGLVKTVEDFGSQGEWPSHPELLDWLATEFVRDGWDMKAMQKTIVMSATYRQSSKATPDLLQKDPENRLLARGPRVRLPAEMVRDQALAISGLLVEKIGGPSVKPYQPAGLVEGAVGRRRLQAGPRRRPAPAQPLHVLEAHRAAADDDELRCGGARGLRGAGVAHQHAAAVAEPDERRHLSGGGAQDGRADDAGRRQRRRQSGSRMGSNWRRRASRGEREAEILLSSFQLLSRRCSRAIRQRRASIWPKAKRRATRSWMRANWPPMPPWPA